MDIKKFIPIAFVVVVGLLLLKWAVTILHFILHHILPSSLTLIIIAVVLYVLFGYLNKQK